MRWFKHYTDNHKGKSIQFLFDSFGYFGVAGYYILLEMCAEKLEQKSDESLTEVDLLFSFHQRIVRQNLRTSLTNLRRLLDQCQTLGLLKFEISSDLIEIKMPILLNLLDSDQKKPRLNRVTSANDLRLDKNRVDKSRIEKNNIIVPTSNEIETVTNSKSLIKINMPNDLANILDHKNRQILFELYGDADFLKREFYKIQNWLDANPKKNHKTKRGWLTFVSNWLEKAWPQFQKNIPTNKSKASSVDELMNMMGW